MFMLRNAEENQGVFETNSKYICEEYDAENKRWTYSSDNFQVFVFTLMIQLMYRVAHKKVLLRLSPITSNNDQLESKLKMVYKAEGCV